jgi:hypothetical protein
MLDEAGPSSPPPPPQPGNTLSAAASAKTLNPVLFLLMFALLCPVNKQFHDESAAPFSKKNPCRSANSNRDASGDAAAYFRHGRRPEPDARQTR